MNNTVIYCIPALNINYFADIEPTYGELIDWFQCVQDEHFDDEAVLCALFNEKYPHIKISRPRRFFDTVQRIASAVQPSLRGRVPLSGSALESYRKRIWRPRVRNPPKGLHSSQAFLCQSYMYAHATTLHLQLDIDF